MSLQRRGVDEKGREMSLSRPMARRNGRIFKALGAFGLLAVAVHVFP